MKRYDIDVTEDDIARARCLKEGLPTRRCPIALAIGRKVDVVRVIVGSWSIVVGEKTVPLNDRAKTFVSDFDAGRPVKPFSFWFRM